MKIIENSTFQADLSDFINQYEVGIYTENELICVVIDLFNESMTEENWCRLPELIQKRVLKMVSQFSDSEEIITLMQSLVVHVVCTSLYVQINVQTVVLP